MPTGRCADASPLFQNAAPQPVRQKISDGGVPLLPLGITGGT
ncbi:hypothetical protein [Gilliamella sp. B14448G11]|nr:hypothetical protein [Gilliamella sp. B14448G11]